MNRSLGLIGLGMLFLAGGWALEKMRRRILDADASAQSAAAIRQRCRRGRCAMKIGRLTLSGASARAARLPVGAGLLHRRQVPLPALDLPSRLDPRRRLRSADANARPLPEPATHRGRLPKHAALRQAGYVSARRERRHQARTRSFCARSPSYFRADLKVENNKLVADAHRGPGGQHGRRGGFRHGPARPATRCASMPRWTSTSPSTRGARCRCKSRQELWIEVTVPPKGPPRPMQLALKQDGVWKPLAFQ